MSQDAPFTPISDLGEFKLLNRIKQSLYQSNGTTILGAGDDAAVINNEHHTVVSSDALVHGVHFDLTYFPLQHLGFKTVVVGISDILAMNAQPNQILISLSISNQFSVEMIELFYQGVNAAAAEYKVDVVGGDISTVHRGLIINVTAIGTVEEGKMVKRNGASENELICASGDFGAAYLGLQLLEREKQIYNQNPEIQPELDEENEYLYQRFLKPDARDDIIKLLNSLNILPTSMIDVSDGLASDLMHICEQSNVGARIYDDKIPVHHNTIDVADSFKLHPTTCALSGGEDFELLFTVKQDAFEKIKNVAELSIIGHIVNKDAGIKLVGREGDLYDLKAQGWAGQMENKQA